MKKSRFVAMAVVFFLAVSLHPSWADSVTVTSAPETDEAVPAPGWTDEMYSSLAGSTDATIEQARERVSLDLAYQELISAAELQFPDTFGGYEIRKTGASALRLDFTEEHEGALATLREKHPEVPRVSSSQVDHSLKRLQALYAQTLTRNDILIDRQRSEEFSSLFLDVENNRVVLGVDTAEDDAVDRLPAGGSLAGRQSVSQEPESLPGPLNEPLEREPEWVGLEIVAETVSAVPTACVNRDDCNSLRGGTRIRSDRGNCTLGYTAYDKVINVPFVVTAAHCGRGFRDYYQGNGSSYYIGRADYALDGYRGSFPGEPDTRFGYDAVRIPDTGPNVGIRPFIYYSRQWSEYPVYGIGTESLHRAGVSRCFSGRTTSGPEGEASCGTSGQGPSRESYVQDGQKWVMDGTYRYDNVCSLDGDSGGPVFNGPYLDGTLWGNTGGGFFDTCTFANGLAYHLVETTVELLGLNPFLAKPPCSSRPPVTC